jgi:hypothetical protein
MNKDIWVYQLLLDGIVVATTVVNDPSDRGCIGAYDANGKYHQYDSYELWHAYSWANERGFVLRSCKKTITIDDSDWFA